MKTDPLILNTTDGTPIAVNRYFPDDSSKLRAIVQIVRGMSEHADRYHEFAEVLSGNDFAVYANHHRGHGKTAGSLENTGYFADSNGWDRVVEDMHQLTQIIIENHPDTPIFLFGHSMGSLLARDYIARFGGTIRGVILSSTAGGLGIMGAIGVLIARLVVAIKGKKHRSKLLNHLSFGSFNQAFKPNRTPFDWLSRDNNEVDQYISDPYCGGIFTAKGFDDLIAGTQKVSAFKFINQIPKDLPALFLCGTHDPVGKNAKGVRKIYEKFVKAGIKDLNYISYPNSRHELLHETNREVVYEDILMWLVRRC